MRNWKIFKRDTIQQKIERLYDLRRPTPTPRWAINLRFIQNKNTKKKKSVACSLKFTVYHRTTPREKPFPKEGTKTKQLLTSAL